MGRPTETKSQVHEKKNVIQNDSTSTKSHDFQNYKALLNYLPLFSILIILFKRDIELMFSPIVINKLSYKSICIYKLVIENIF